MLSFSMNGKAIYVESKPAFFRRDSGRACCHTYGLSAKREVKITGYWPSSFFAGLKTRKKRTSQGQYPAILTKQAGSIKDLLYRIKHLKMIFDLAGASEKSRAGKIAPSCLLRLANHRAESGHIINFGVTCTILQWYENW